MNVSKKSILGTIFALGALGYLEATGYALFDQENGKNLLCDLDPACRYLTQDEIRESQKIFGKKIPYQHVKVFSRMNLITGFGRFPPMQAPNGNIYDIKSIQDYTKKYAREFGKFIHEMTHVLQKYQGENLVTAVFNAWASNDFHYDDAYNYDEEWSKVSFAALNIEQQAEVVRDYALERRVYETMYAALPELDYSVTCIEIKKYEDYLQDAAALTQVEDCKIVPPSEKKIVPGHYTYY